MTYTGAKAAAESRELLWIGPGLALLGHHASETAPPDEVEEEQKLVGSGQGR